MPLSTDALIFGLGFLNGPRARLSFGGEGAQMRITPRGARRAVRCRLREGRRTGLSDRGPGVLSGGGRGAASGAAREGGRA